MGYNFVREYLEEKRRKKAETLASSITSNTLAKFVEDPLMRKQWENLTEDEQIVLRHHMHSGITEELLENNLV